MVYQVANSQWANRNNKRESITAVADLVQLIPALELTAHAGGERANASSLDIPRNEPCPVCSWATLIEKWCHSLDEFEIGCYQKEKVSQGRVYDGQLCSLRVRDPFFNLQLGMEEGPSVSSPVIQIKGTLRLL